MKKISLVLVCCLSTVAQAEYRMLMPLEVKNNGRLPDGSIIFSGANGPTTPVDPVEEGTDCMVDVAAGTYYLVQEAAGESMIGGVMVNVSIILLGLLRQGIGRKSMRSILQVNMYF